MSSLTVISSPPRQGEHGRGYRGKSRLALVATDVMKGSQGSQVSEHGYRFYRFYRFFPLLGFAVAVAVVCCCCLLPLLFGFC